MACVSVDMDGKCAATMPAFKRFATYLTNFSKSHSYCEEEHVLTAFLLMLEMMRP
jgi:ligand-binding sensor protein